MPQLDREIERLPDKYRIPVVLCELEGRSRKDVARQLKVPEGTLSSRLATARKLLAKRLARYGLAMAAAGLSQADAASGVPQALLLSMLQATTGQTATVSANVIALVEGVVKLMFLNKLRIVGCAVVAFTLLGLGAGELTYPAPRAEARQAEQAKTVEDVFPTIALPTTMTDVSKRVRRRHPARPAHHATGNGPNPH